MSLVTPIVSAFLSFGGLLFYIIYIYRLRSIKLHCIAIHSYIHTYITDIATSHYVALHLHYVTLCYLTLRYIKYKHTVYEYIYGYGCSI